MNDIAELFDAAQEEPTEEVSESQEETQEVEQKVDEAPAAKEVEEETTEQPKEQETTSESEDKEGSQEWTLKAVQNLREEKRKLREELEALKAEKPKEEVETPDVFEDQDGFKNHLQQETRQQILAVQRDMMMEFKGDYEEKEQAFFDIAKDNPALIAEANNSPNPAKFAYEQGNKFIKYQEIQNVDQMESKIRGDLEQKIRAEIEAEYKAKSTAGDNLSPTLTKVRGSTEKDAVVPENPEDIFN